MESTIQWQDSFNLVSFKTTADTLIVSETMGVMNE